MVEDKNNQIIQDENRLLVVAMNIFIRLLMLNKIPIYNGGKPFVTLKELHETIQKQSPYDNILLSEVEDVFKKMWSAFQNFVITDYRDDGDIAYCY